MNSWTDTTQSLPVEREYVRFRVIGHNRALLGVYQNQNFCSRWGSYDKAQVCVWRKLGDITEVRPPGRTASEQRYWSERPMRESC